MGGVAVLGVLCGSWAPGRGFGLLALAGPRGWVRWGGLLLFLFGGVGFWLCRGDAIVTPSYASRRSPQVGSLIIRRMSRQD